MSEYDEIMARVMAGNGVMMDLPKKYPGAAINQRAKFCGVEWSHLWCNPGHEEKLHAVAKSLGLRRDWFQDRKDFPHYDLTVGKYWQANKLGVPVVNLREYVKRRFCARATKEVVAVAEAFGKEQATALPRGNQLTFTLPE